MKLSLLEGRLDQLMAALPRAKDYVQANLNHVADGAMGRGTADEIHLVRSIVTALSDKLKQINLTPTTQVGNKANWKIGKGETYKDLVAGNKESHYVQKIIESVKAGEWAEAGRAFYYFKQSAPAVSAAWSRRLQQIQPQLYKQLTQAVTDFDAALMAGMEWRK